MRGVRRRDQIARGHPAARAVAEDERSARLADRLQVNPGSTVRRFDVDSRNGYGSSSGASPKWAKASGVTNAVTSLICEPSSVMTSIADARQRPVSSCSA